MDVPGTVQKFSHLRRVHIALWLGGGPEFERIFAHLEDPCLHSLEVLTVAGLLAKQAVRILRTFPDLKELDEYRVKIYLREKYANATYPPLPTRSQCGFKSLHDASQEWGRLCTDILRQQYYGMSYWWQLWNAASAFVERVVKLYIRDEDQLLIRTLYLQFMHPIRSFLVHAVVQDRKTTGQ